MVPLQELELVFRHTDRRTNEQTKRWTVEIVTSNKQMRKPCDNQTQEEISAKKIDRYYRHVQKK